MSSFKKGGIYILSSPSGAGKTTLVKKISKIKNFSISVSHTTRHPRPNEKMEKIIILSQKIILKNSLRRTNFLSMQRYLTIIMDHQKN